MQGHSNARVFTVQKHESYDNKCAFKQMTSLRQELQDILSSLHTKIQVQNGYGLPTKREQVYQAEVSAIRRLLAFCLKALLGDSLTQDENYMGLGSIRDWQDSLSLNARELKLEREQVEADFGTLTRPVLDPVSQNALTQLVVNENQTTHAIEKNEGEHCRLIQHSIGQCCKDMCGHLLKALEQARKGGTSTSERRDLAADATKKITDVVSQWLTWYAKAEPQIAAPPTIWLTPEVTMLSMQNVQAGKYIQALRQCMHLRRQQARLIALMQRIAAAVHVGDIVCALEENIQCT